MHYPTRSNSNDSLLFVITEPYPFLQERFVQNPFGAGEDNHDDDGRDPRSHENGRRPRTGSDKSNSDGSDDDDDDDGLRRREDSLVLDGDRNGSSRRKNGENRRYRRESGEVYRRRQRQEQLEQQQQQEARRPQRQQEPRAGGDNANANANDDGSTEEPQSEMPTQFPGVLDRGREAFLHTEEEVGRRSDGDLEGQGERANIGPPVQVGKRRRRIVQDEEETV